MWHLNDGTPHASMMFITTVYNEESHCVRLIEDLCKLKWPRDRLLIQVQ